MRKTLIRTGMISILLAAILSFSIPVSAEQAFGTALSPGSQIASAQTAEDLDPSSQTFQQFQTTVTSVSNSGNVTLGLDGYELVDVGYELGDCLKVTIGEETLTLPFVSTHNQLIFMDAGIVPKSSVRGEAFLVLMIEGGNFAAEHPAFQEGTEVTIDMGIEDGYKEEMNARTLPTYSDTMEDFDTIEEFANFRAVATTGIRENTLYRTASPVDPKRNRNTYADALLRSAGVTTVINLADSPDTVAAFEGYDQSYYATTDHIELSMKPNYGSDDFNQKVAESLRFMIDHPGIYAVHCLEGKDRTGFVIAALECLMGASYEEVVSDYMISFWNYYKVTPEESRYALIAEGALIAQLKYAFGVTDLQNTNLSEAAAAYLKRTGLTSTEISKLKGCLAPEAAPDVTPAKVVKKTNPMKVKKLKSVKTVKYKKIKKKSRTLTFLKVTGAQGKVTYKKVGGSKRLTVNKRTGKITVKKKTKRGVYKIKVKVKAAGNSKYKALSKTVTLKVRIK